jgi:cytochrome b pre-mRNA-processing protein 3
MAMTLFLGLNKILGYDSVKQVSGRRASFMYQVLCTPRADEELEFWKNGELIVYIGKLQLWVRINCLRRGLKNKSTHDDLFSACHLPPTFQSWFTITNLHIWLLTVRCRALPPPDGHHLTQALIDHFFMDIEKRIRFVLQPHPKAVAPANSRYYLPIADAEAQQTVNEDRRGRAPDRLVTQQMKIFKEQWTGMGMALDLGMVRSDMEMAAAVWRNLLGARGARGIAYAPPGSPMAPSFRRSVNPVGGSEAAIKQIEKVGLETEEARDDGSGVYDFPPDQADKYVQYPQTILDVVEYMRRELVRLESVSDETFMRGDLEGLKFGPIESRA